MGRHPPKLILVTFLIIILVCGRTSNAWAQSLSELGEYSQVEQFILNKVANGEKADLNEFSIEGKDHLISSVFLENLLSGSIIDIPRKGVNIANVTVQGLLDLKNTQIEFEVSFVDCKFINSIDFEQATVESLEFSSCTFEENVSFHEAQILNSLYLHDLEIKRVFDFSYLDVGRNLEIINSHFISSDKITFNSMEIGDSAFIDGAIFEGTTDFGYSRINGILSLRNTTINSHEESSFNSMKVGHSAFFGDTYFSGPVDFGQLIVGVNLDFSRSRFSSENRIRFNNINIGGSIFLHDASFSGPVFWGYSEIGGVGDFTRAEFTSPNLLELYLVTFGQGAVFQNTIFNGPIDFGNINSGGSLVFDQVEFKSQDNIRFSQISLDGFLSIQDSLLAGNLLINQSNFKNGLAINGLEPIVSNESIAIEITRFEGNILSLNNVVFNNFDLLIINSDINDLGISGGNEFITLNILSLAGSKINNKLTIERMSIGEFVGSRMISYGTADFIDTEISMANFEYAKFETLRLQNVLLEESENLNQLQLNGLQYTELIPGLVLTENNWKRLLDLLNSATYNSILYADLETFFVDNGHPEWADKVHVSQKRRERSEVLHWYSYKWWWNLFMDGFILYGRQPSRAFLWSAIIILIGRYIFSNSKMVAVDDYTGERYSPFLYSLDLYIPYCDLGIARKWKLKSTAMMPHVYHGVHILLGWIIIPVGLLVTSGLIK